ncbi:MAG: hypothetical protein LBN32_04295 [Helicobacteraceae bacterium]|jgi:hypothetical protein|nr:hypothetical protein [Helicobacteraceae bacterium]
MTLNVTKSGNHYRIDIDGTIKSISDSQAIKDAIQQCESDSQDLRLYITNSFSVTSSVIGFLLKKVQVDKLNLSISVTDDRLLDLFKSLNLADILNVSKS